MKKLIIVFCLLLAGVAACSKFDEPVSGLQEETESSKADKRPQTRSVTAFDTLPDPYALENMQAIYDSLSRTPQTLQPTHLYVRFRPQDPQQLEELEQYMERDSLDLYEYPLDIEIPEGVEYVDPTIPEGEMGWYYIGVKFDFVFPDDITYEIIRECYIPEEKETIETIDTRGGENDIDVEKAAYERLGYDTGIETRAGVYSDGHVYVKDDNGANVPVAGVRVKINSWIKSSWVYTNSQGYFKAQMKFWQDRLNYEVVFIHRDFVFRQRNGLIFERAKHKKNMSKYGGNIILSSGEPRQYGAMFVAACDYYAMCAREGITKPPKDLKILYFPSGLGYGGSTAIMAHRDRDNLRRLLEPIVEWAIQKDYLDRVWKSGLLTVLTTNGPDLIIDKYNSYENIYGTMNHELSHASHYSKVGDNFWERYIEYMANSLTRTDEIYGDGDGQYAGHCAVGEMWGYSVGDIRMSEEFNQSRLEGPYVDTSYYYPYDFSHSGINGWIKPDPIWALITRGVLTKKQVFDCLTADVTTVAALEAKMCEKYPDEADMIRFAFANDDTLMAEITGSDVIETLSNVSYSTQMQANTISVTFDIPNAVRGTDYSVVSDVTNSGTRIWTIRFLKQGSYTIIANYQLDGNKNFSSDKEVYAFSSPDISVDKTAVIINETVKFTVNNPADGFQYIWKVNGIEGRPNPGASRTLSTTVTEPIDVFCQAYLNGEPFGDPSQTISVTMPLGNAIPPIPEFSSHKTVASAGSTVKFKVKNYNPFWTGLTFEWHKGTDGGFGTSVTHVETSGEFSTTIDGLTTEIWCVVRLDGREIRRTPAVTVQSTQLPDYDVLLQDRWLKEKGEPWFVRSQLFIELDPDQRYLKDSNILSRYFIGTTWALTGHSTNHYYIPEDCLDMVTELIGRNADYDWGYDFPGGFGSPRSFLTSQVAPPTPVITADKTEAAMGESVTFTVNNHAPGATYKWFRYSYAMTFVEKPGETGPSFTTELDFPTIKAYCVAYLDGLPSDGQSEPVAVDWNHDYAPDLLRMSDAERGQWMMNRTALR